MTRTNTSGPRISAKVVGALLAGHVVIAALLPWIQLDSDPPICRSMFDYVIPCGAGLALAAGVTTASIVGLALWLVNRRN